MAIYRLSADIVRRSAGRTVTAAAAYRSAELIVDARTGLAFDYRRRSGVVHAEIVAPDDAPAWMQDRARLWNGVELAEKRRDAQLARDIELALPHELTHAERRDLVQRFARAAFAGMGMVADVAIHAPGRDGDRRNFHAHILLTLRGIEGDGFGPKQRAWNDPAVLERWRTLWADHVNQALAQIGERERVDHRSLAAQGIARLPQIHLGRAVIEMHRRGVTTDRAELAGAIAAVNRAAPATARAGEAMPAAIAPGRTKPAPTAALRAPALRSAVRAMTLRIVPRFTRLPAAAMYRYAASEETRRVFRVRRRKTGAPVYDEQPRPPFNRPEWESARVLAQAFAEGRYDVLAMYDIFPTLEQE